MVFAIGSADDFWRLRTVRVDTIARLEFEWHDDILYRQPFVVNGDEVEFWNVEAIRIDDAEQVLRLGTFKTVDEAQKYLAAVSEDLTTMTKAQFEAAYFTQAEQGDTGNE